MAGVMATSLVTWLCDMEQRKRLRHKVWFARGILGIGGQILGGPAGAAAQIAGQEWRLFSKVQP